MNDVLDELPEFDGGSNETTVSKKIVTEPVYPLSSKVNYTGIEVPCYDGEVLVDGATYTKVADNVYEPSELNGKGYVGGNASGEISFYSYIGDNGSFVTNKALGVVVVAEDVGKRLNVFDFDVTFPESGTYLSKAVEFFVAGTYKREIEPQDFGMIVEGELDPATFNVVSLNREYQEIAEALTLKKDVRLLLNVPLGDDGSVSVLGTVETFRSSQGIIEFGVIIDTTLNVAEGEQVYHFRITLAYDGTVSTERKLLSGSVAEEQDNSFRMFMYLNWNSLTADFPSGEAPSFASLSFQDIYEAFDWRNLKNAVTRISWYDEDNDGRSRSVYTSDVAVLEGFADYPQKKQIVISAILNIDVQNGLGKQDYYFKFILNEDDTVITEYQLIGDSSGGGTNDYTKLINKPKINGVELVGDLTSAALGLDVGGGSGEAWKFIKTTTLSEPVTSIYETFGAEYKKIHIEFDELRVDEEAPASAIGCWIAVNSNRYVSNKAFSPRGTSLESNAIIYGQNYNCYGILDIIPYNDYVVCSYQFSFGSGHFADNSIILRTSNVGSTINSIYLYLVGNVNISQKFNMNVWGVRA